MNCCASLEVKEFLKNLDWSFAEKSSLGNLIDFYGPPWKPKKQKSWKQLLCQNWHFLFNPWLTYNRFGPPSVFLLKLHLWSAIFDITFYFAQTSLTCDVAL